MADLLDKGWTAGPAVVMQSDTEGFIKMQMRKHNQLKAEASMILHFSSTISYRCKRWTWWPKVPLSPGLRGAGLIWLQNPVLLKTK